MGQRAVEVIEQEIDVFIEIFIKWWRYTHQWVEAEGEAVCTCVGTNIIISATNSMCWLQHKEHLWEFKNKYRFSKYF